MACSVYDSPLVLNKLQLQNNKYIEQGWLTDCQGLNKPINIHPQKTSGWTCQNPKMYHPWERIASYHSSSYTLCYQDSKPADCPNTATFSPKKSLQHVLLDPKHILIKAKWTLNNAFQVR